MKKTYESPDLELFKLNLENVLDVSTDEIPTDPYGVEHPTDDWLDDEGF